MEFVKAHGAGNDFVLLPDLHDTLVLTPELTAALCMPHLGLGADGVIRIAPSRNADDDVYMDYRNADGSVAEMCGNGVRCVAKYVADRGMVPGEQIRVDTRGGTRTVHVVERCPDGRVAQVRVDMGIPEPGKVDWPIELNHGGQVKAGDPRITTVSMGNPHAVCVTDDIAAWPLEAMAAQLQEHPAFPEGVNLEVVTVLDRSRIAGRIFERGVGETLASGTGASAMAVAAIVLGHTESIVDVELPGGTLSVDWTGDRLLVTGPAVEVAHGTLDPTWLTAT